MSDADALPAGSAGTVSATSPAAMRQRILGAAFDAFMAQGYAGTSTLDIATRARVSKRDLYAQFSNKQAMLEACIVERAQRMRAPLHLPAPRDRRGLAMTLVHFGTTVLREATQPEVLAVYRLAILEAERAPDVARTLDESGRAATRAALAALLGQAQAGGLLGAGDPAELADTFTALLWGGGGGLLVRLLLRVTDSPDEAACEARARRATQALLALAAAAG